MHHQLGILVQLGIPPRDLAQRNQHRAGNAVDLVFVRLADVDDDERVAAIETLLQLDRRDLGRARGRRAGRRRCRLDRRTQTAELLVVDERGHGRVGAADRAIRILPELQLAEFHAERVIDHEAPDQRLTDAGDELDRLGRLDDADDARQHAQHAAFSAARHQTGWRRLRIEAAIAGAVLGREHRGLTFEAEDRAVGVRLAEQHACVVRQVARRKVVRAVEDDVVRREQLERVLGRQRRLVGIDLDVRVDVDQPRLRRLQLGLADRRGAVNDLALQVAVVDDVEVDDADAADAGRREVHRRRRPESARTDAQHAASLQPALPVHSDLRHDQMPAVSIDLLVGQLRKTVKVSNHRKSAPSCLVCDGLWPRARMPSRL